MGCKGRCLNMEPMVRFAHGPQLLMAVLPTIFPFYLRWLLLFIVYIIMIIFLHSLFFYSSLYHFTSFIDFRLIPSIFTCCSFIKHWILLYCPVLDVYKRQPPYLSMQKGNLHTYSGKVIHSALIQLVVSGISFYCLLLLY